MTQNAALTDEFYDALPELVIRPSKGWTSLNLRDLWHYRELALFLIWRDISVRYKQTVLGAAWAILQAVHDGDLQRILRPAWEDPFRRAALPHLHLLRPAAVAAIRLFDYPIRQQPGGEPEPDQQGVLPAHHHFSIGDSGGGGGLRDRLSGIAGDDGILPHPADLGGAHSAAVRSSE
jgi:hypothetical protein